MCADFQRKASTVFHGENKEGKTLQRNTQYILALFLLLHWILRRWKTVISSISNTTAGPISSWDLPQELQAPVLKLCCLNVYFSIPYIEPQLPHFQFVTTGCSDSHCASRQEPSLVPGALPTAPRGCSPVPRHWLHPRVQVIRKHEGCRHMGSAPAPGQALLSCVLLLLQAHPVLLSKVTSAARSTSTWGASICFCYSSQLCHHSRSLLQVGAPHVCSYLGRSRALCWRQTYLFFMSKSRPPWWHQLISQLKT